MQTVFHKFAIDAPLAAVVDAITTPDGLNSWWSKTCSGAPKHGEIYQLGFGPGYDWKATVSKCSPNEFELTFTDAMEDWIDTRVGFMLSEKNSATQIEFYHSGWRKQSEHFKISSYCWAMYLRLLRRYVELGEVVEYEKRNDV